MREHGSYSLAVNNQTHILKAYGAWNYQTAKRWGEDTKQLVSPIIDKPWACLVDLSGWELGTPDIREYLYGINSWFNDNKLKYLAVVYSLSLQKDVLAITHAAFTNVEVQYFENINEANEWLMQNGY